ncbi:MAG: cytochrome C oxidase subunit IV family protein [Bacteroidetes bacterium]|nr:cytochrome C oxidase subunit IV family protein [Bacteroidota bacterium]
MSEFHDDYPQYELMAHHSEEEGVKKRKKLWNVFWIMLTITIIELIIGSKAASMGLLDDVTRTSGITLKFIFIGLTILKAFFIVFSFMHLGEERKFLKFAIVGPYMIFILYLIWMCVTEANYARIHKNDMDSIIVQQKIELNKAATSGHHEETAKPAEGANP